MNKRISGVLGTRRPASITLRSSFGIRCLLVLSTLFIPQMAASAGALDEPISLEIAPNTPLDQALIRWGAETGVQVMMNAQTLNQERTQGLRGTQPASRALATLLKGSGLSYSVEGNTVLVVPIALTDQKQTIPAGRRDDSLKKEAAGGQNTQFAVRRNEIEEVVVSAQKREERLQDVPVPVTAINTQNLIETDQIRLQDYFTRVPGLTATPDDENGAPIVTIRGITTGGYTNPTVGIVVDDVPFGSSTSTAVGNIAPDIDPFDLADIEVLRGPQGTLYGAGSMGGLIKYTTVDPSFDGISGRLQAGTSTIHNAGKLGYNLRGAVNVPLSATFALRTSVFTREDPGYVDNPVLHINGINKAESSGAHLLALWKPSGDFSIKLSAFYQDDKRFGSNDAFPALGDLKQDFLLNTGRYAKKIQAYSATIRARFEDVDFVSISGYSKSEYKNTLDFSAAISPYSEPIFGVSGVPASAHVTTKKASQEFRFSGAFADNFDWLLGAFYTHEDSPAHTDYVGEDPLTGQTVGDITSLSFPTTFEEYAGFADLTVHLTRQFDIQLGARESRNRQSYNETDTGPLVEAFFDFAPSPFVYPQQKSKDNAFTYLVTPRYRITSDLMLYARMASGYRPGGPNPGAQLYGYPSEFGADKTQDYEVGLKGNVLQHFLSFDASAYYIRWKDIQALAIDPVTFIGFYANGNRAKSEGVELSLQAAPSDGLTVSGWIAWNEAVLTEPFSPITYLVGSSGDRLPYSSRYSGNVSIDQTFRLNEHWRTDVGASFSYVGDRLGEFPTLYGAQPPQRQVLGGYGQADVTAGLSRDSWDVKLFVNNVTDRRGLLRGGLNSIYPYAFNYIQPRTVGLSIAKSF